MDVTLGDIIKIVLIAGGWIVTIVKIDGRLKSVEKDIKEVTTLVKWRERLEERVMNIRRDVDDLRRRRGFIQGEVDGEYEGTGHSKT
jgi:hypothetical protein